MKLRYSMAIMGVLLIAGVILTLVFVKRANPGIVILAAVMVAFLGALPVLLGEVQKRREEQERAAKRRTQAQQAQKPNAPGARKPGV